MNILSLVTHPRVASEAIWLWCFFLRNTKREVMRNCISRFFLCNYNEQGAKLSSFKKCQSYSIRFLNRTGLWNWHHYSLTVFGSLNQWVELKNLISLIHQWIIQSWSVKLIKWFTKKIRLQRKVHSKIRHHYLITLLNQTWAIFRESQHIFQSVCHTKLLYDLEDVEYSTWDVWITLIIYW